MNIILGFLLGHFIASAIVAINKGNGYGWRFIVAAVLTAAALAVYFIERGMGQ